MTKTAIIVAPGMTLNLGDLPRMHEVADTVVALNRAAFAWNAIRGPMPDRVYAMDGPACFGEELEGFLSTVDYLVTEASLVERWESMGVHRVEGLRIDRRRRWETNPFDSPENVYTGPLKTTLLAWQHLIREGYKRIGFVGVDGRVEDRPYFYDAPVDEKRVSGRRSSYSRTIKVMKHWYPFSLEAGVESVNLSGRESRLASFMPSVPIGAFLTEDLRAREGIENVRD